MPAKATLMRVLIVDDESPACERLRRLLGTIDDVQLIGEAADGLEAVDLIERLSPDLVLLDIQMPGMDGFDVMQALDNPPPIIFVTAYDEYAIRAFEVHALDYLLKPLRADRLAEAIARARRMIHLDGRRDLAARLKPLVETLTAEGRYLTRLAVRAGERIRVLDVGDVDWIGIEDDQVLVHVGESVYPVQRTLSDLEARLSPQRFFRAHRSAIVNLDHVRDIASWFKGSYILRLTSGAEVELSRAKARALRRILGW